MKTLVIVGAINWGLVGALDLDVVQLIFGSVSWLADIVYILTGVSGLVLLMGGCKCRMCKGGACEETKKEEACEEKGGCCGGGSCE